MKIYSFYENGKKKEFKVPISRADITYSQWNKAYEYMNIAYDADQEYNKGNFEQSSIKIVQSMCHTIASLSQGITYEELINIEMDKIVSMFNIDFQFLKNEQPKKDFNINGVKFSIPDFSKATAGDFMDATAMLSQLAETKTDADIGIIIAAIYMRNGDYIQDLAEINKRIEFIKEHGRMDLFYSCAFFLTRLFSKQKTFIKPPTEVAEEMAKLTSYLNEWGITLYLQALRNQKYFSIRV